MKLFKEHELIPTNASKEEVEKILAESSFRAIRRTTALLSGDKESFFRINRNIEEILEYDLKVVTATYNLVALTINYRLDKALEIFKQFVELWPTLKNIQNLDDVIGIFASVEEEDETDVA